MPRRIARALALTLFLALTLPGSAAAHVADGHAHPASALPGRSAELLVAAGIIFAAGFAFRQWRQSR